MSHFLCNIFFGNESSLTFDPDNLRIGMQTETPSQMTTSNFGPKKESLKAT